MQDNIITLPVDTANTGSTTDLALERAESVPGRSIYHAPSHSLAMNDKLTLYRTNPKANGNFRGQAKSKAKFTMDIEVPGVDATTTVVAPYIIEISTSQPVGTPSATALLGRQRGVALLDLDAVMIKLAEKLIT